MTYHNNSKRLNLRKKRKPHRFLIIMKDSPLVEQQLLLLSILLSCHQRLSTYLWKNHLVERLR